MSANRKFLSASIVRAVQLNAVANWLEVELKKHTAALELVIVGKIAKADPTFNRNRIERSQRTHALFAAVENEIIASFREVRAATESHFKELSSILVDKIAADHAQHFDSAADKVSLSGIVQTPVLGATLKDWCDRLAGDLNFRFQQQMRQGIGQDETLQQLIARVKGNSRG